MIDHSNPNWYIQVFDEYSKEYKTLTKFAELLNENTPEYLVFSVEDFYFDGGQGWMWTSILKYDYREKSFMKKTWALNPRQQEDILSGRESKVLNDILAKLEEEEE